MKPKLNRSMKKKGQYIFIVFSIMLGMTGVAMAENEPPMLGKWVGTYADKNDGLIAVTITLNELKIHGQNSDMLFSAPYRCSIGLEYIGVQDKDYILRVNTSNGGRCDVYRDGSIYLYQDSDRKLNFFLMNRSGKLSIEGKLNYLN